MVRTTEIRVTCEEEAPSYLLHIDHHIARVADGPHHDLVFDLSRCPFVLENASVFPGGLSVRDRHLVRYLGHQDWERASFQYTVRWHPGKRTGSVTEPMVLRLPFDLPFLSGDDNSPRPHEVPKVIVQPCSPQLRMTTVGVPADLQGSHTNKGFFSVSFYPGEPTLLLHDQATTVLVTSALGEVMGPELENLHRAVATALQHLTRLMGPITGLGILLGSSEDRAGSEPTFGSGTMILSTDDILQSPVSSDPFCVELIQGLASVWWGTAIQCVGVSGLEFSSSMGTAIAADWARRSAPPFFEHLMATLQAWTRTPWYREWAAARRGHLRLGRVSRLALGLLNGRRIDLGVGEEFRRLVYQYWGFALDEEVPLRDLAAMGVYVPHGRGPLRRLRRRFSTPPLP